MRRTWSSVEKASLVAEYLVLPYGTKLAWLAERRITHDRMRVWRLAYLYGDLDRELAPRDTSTMSVSDAARVRQLELALEAEHKARLVDSERFTAELERMQQVNDALGKAIGLLHDRAVRQEPEAES
jgi:hypothetical protein